MVRRPGTTMTSYRIAPTGIGAAAVRRGQLRQQELGDEVEIDQPVQQPLREVLELRLARLALDGGVFERTEARPEQLDRVDDADADMRLAGLEGDIELGWQPAEHDGLVGLRTLDGSIVPAEGCELVEGDRLVGPGDVGRMSPTLGRSVLPRPGRVPAAEPGTGCGIRLPTTAVAAHVTSTWPWSTRRGVPGRGLDHSHEPDPVAGAGAELSGWLVSGRSAGPPSTITDCT